LLEEISSAMTPAEEFGLEFRDAGANTIICYQTRMAVLIAATGRNSGEPGAAGPVGKRIWSL